MFKINMINLMVKICRHVYPLLASNKLSCHIALPPRLRSTSTGTTIAVAVALFILQQLLGNTNEGTALNLYMLQRKHNKNKTHSAYLLVTWSQHRKDSKVERQTTLITLEGSMRRNSVKATSHVMSDKRLIW